MENSKPIPANPSELKMEQSVQTETRSEAPDREAAARNREHLSNACEEGDKAAVEAETNPDLPSSSGSRKSLEWIRKRVREHGIFEPMDPEELKQREADPEYQARRKRIRELLGE